MNLPHEPSLSKRLKVAPYGHIGNTQLLYELAHSRSAVRLHALDDRLLALGSEHLGGFSSAAAALDDARPPPVGRCA